MKRTSAILLLLIVGLTLKGLSQDYKKFRFGLKGCPALGWIKPDVYITDDQKILLPESSVKEYTSEGMTFGFSYGAVLELAFGSNYSFTTGATIAHTGGKLQYPHQPKIKITDSVMTTGTLLRKFNIQYVEIPLLLKMKTNEIGYITYFGQFGFGAGFNIAATADDHFDYTGSAGGSELNKPGIDIKSEKEISFLRGSLIIGAGIEYSLGGNTSVVAGVNFNNGFTDILRGENDIVTDIKEKAISNYLEINLGILF